MAERACPVWKGYLLVSPIRRFLQNPKKILAPYIKEDMAVLDLGCAMGFFSIPLARMVGPKGKVICVDLQPGMISALQKRAKRTRLAARIESRLCSKNSLELAGLENSIDFALASAVVHEIPDTDGFFSQVHKTLKPGALMLVIEPKGHVNAADFRNSIDTAQKQGFKVLQREQSKHSYTVLMRKQAK